MRPVGFLAQLAEGWQGGWTCGAGWRPLEPRSLPSVIR